MRVVVLGVGSLGSLVGGLLAAANPGTSVGSNSVDDVVVTLLARESDHARRLDRDGLRLTHTDGSEETIPVDVATDYEAAANADLLVVCVKSYDTADAMAAVSPHLDGADVLTVQNGLGNAETIAEYVPEERVLAGTTTHGAVREEPGRVRHAGTGETTIGRYFAGNDARVDAVAAVLSAAGIETTVTDDPVAAVWTKVIVNAGINAATALARVPNGALADHEPGRRLLRRAVQEGADVARASDVDVPDDAVERALDVAECTATNASSMRQDVERERRTEIEALNGELERRADELGVEAPVNRTLADLVRLAGASRGRTDQATRRS